MNYFNKICILFLCVLIYSCSSHELKIDSIPKASSEVFNIRKKNYSNIMTKYSFSSDETKEDQLNKLQLMFKKDDNNNQVYKQVVRKGLSYGGEQDSIKSIQELACKNALVKAIQDVNGVYIQTITQVKNSLITQDDIFSKTLGIAKIKNKKTYPEFNSNGSFKIECEVTADIPEITYNIQ